MNSSNEVYPLYNCDPRMMSTGLTPKDILETIRVDRNTVRKYVNGVRDVLDVRMVSWKVVEGITVISHD